jgi:RNA polymerase sigma factor (sigma-70 family)
MTCCRISGVRSPLRCSSGTGAACSSGGRRRDRRTRGRMGRFEARVDDRDVLWAALAHLSPQQRVVVVLRIVEDLSEDQTAAMLGVPVGTVKSRLSRALTVLRAILEDDRG